MRCKIDERLPLEIKDLLVQHQHDAVTVAEQGMAGNIDPDMAQVCRKEGRALMTLDLVFSDTRAYPPEDYHGIVVFRPAIQSITTLVRLTTRLIVLLERESLIGNLWIVEDHQVRIREGSQGQTRVTRRSKRMAVMHCGEAKRGSYFSIERPKPACSAPLLAVSFTRLTQRHLLLARR